MLKLDNVSYSRNNNMIINQFNLEVTKGSLIEIKGSNGVGKTTLLKLMAGLIEVDAGEINWHDQPITNIDANYKSAFTFIGHKFGIKLQLTVLENLQFMQLLANTNHNFDLITACEIVGLQDYQNQVCTNLSAGQLQRLALARLLINKYDLWILDEPFANLDAAGINLLINLAKEQMQTGMIVISTHQDINWQNINVSTINLNDNISN